MAQSKSDRHLKALTLGWDFDPAVSGGVGPACRGLSTALRAMGVDLIYVVPSYGEGHDDPTRLRLTRLSNPQPEQIPYSPEYRVMTHEQIAARENKLRQEAEQAAAEIAQREEEESQKAVPSSDVQDHFYTAQNTSIDLETVDEATVSVDMDADHEAVSSEMDSGEQQEDRGQVTGLIAPSSVVQPEDNSSQPREEAESETIEERPGPDSFPEILQLSSTPLVNSQVGQMDVRVIGHEIVSPYSLPEELESVFIPFPEEEHTTPIIEAASTDVPESWQEEPQPQCPPQPVNEIGNASPESELRPESEPIPDAEMIVETVHEPQSEHHIESHQEQEAGPKQEAGPETPTVQLSAQAPELQALDADEVIEFVPQSITEAEATPGIEVDDSLAVEEENDSPLEEAAIPEGEEQIKPRILDVESPHQVKVEEDHRPIRPPHNPHDYSLAYLHDQVMHYVDECLQMVSDDDFDVVHAHDWMTFPAATAVAGLKRKPLILHVHSVEFDRRPMDPHPMILTIERRAFQSADQILCVSGQLSRRLVEAYSVPPEKIKVAINGRVDDPMMEPVEAMKVDQEEPLILFMGRLSSIKGPSTFLAAAKKALQVLPNLRFIMAGDGELLPWLVEQSVEMGIHRRVTFTGFLNQRDKVRMLKSAAAYVMPSWEEPFGLTVMEAMRSGTPVIVSRHAGVSEAVKNVIKVDAWDTQQVTAAILKVCRDQEETEAMVHEAGIELRHLEWRHAAEVCVKTYWQLLSD